MSNSGNPLISFKNINEDKRLENFFRDNLNGTGQKVYKILYVGTCFQNSILFPFLETLLNHQGIKKVNVTTVISENSFNVFANENSGHLFRDMTVIPNDKFQKLKNAQIKRKLVFIPDFTHETALDRNKKEEILVNLSQDKIEATTKCAEVKQRLEQGDFDYIFCLFENHFEINWRIGLINLLKKLKQGGHYFFANITGDFKVLDGNFKPSTGGSCNRDLIDLLMKSDKKRSELHYWKPELSVSNYKEMRNQISRIFESIKGETEETGYFRRADSITFSKSNLEKIINDGSLAYFRVGLADSAKSSQFKSELIKEIRNCNHTFNINLQLYCAFNYQDKWLNALKSLEWNYAALTKDLQQINDNNLDSLGQKALDLLASHDMIFPQHTRYLALIEWTDPRSNEWEYPVHFLINDRLWEQDNKPNDKPSNIETNRYSADVNNQELHKKLKTVISSWYNRERGHKASLAKMIFQNSTRKVIVRFTYKENLAHTQKEPIEVDLGDSKENVDYDYRYVKDRKGNVKELNILLAHNWTGKEDSSGDGLEINDQPLVQGISRYQLTRSKTINKDSTPISDEPFKIDDEGELKEKLPLLLALAIQTHFYKSERIDHELTFYPSAIIEKKGSADGIEIEGLGGIILYEKCIDSKGDSNYKKILKTLYEARNRALTDATNLIFYKASIVSHVDQDFKRHARKAAIAAINARNSSHIIGAHVFPDIINNDKFTTEHHQTFFRYLMRRGEYIAQLTSDFPTWSVPTWFGQELMAEFYRQYCLLDSIASAEGVRSYDFGDKRDTHVPKLLIEIRKRCWLSVNNGVVDESRPLLSQHYKNDVVDIAEEPDLEKIERYKKFYGIVVVDETNYGLLYFKDGEVLDNYHVLKLDGLDENVKKNISSGIRIIVEGEFLKEEKTISNAKVLEITSETYIVKCKSDFTPKQNDDIQISIPGGIIGYHAFYIILENIIRNAAKHDREENKQENLHVTIELEEKELFYICKVWTNAHSLYKRQNDKICLINKSRDKENPPDQENPLRHKINGYLAEDIITLKGEHKKEHLGISEIKINAAFLANQNLDVEENISGEKVVLKDKDLSMQEGYIKASGIWELDDKNKLVARLGYRFKLLKPKEVLVVSDGDDFPKGDQATLREHHIKRLKHKEAFNTSDLNYEFCLIVNDETEDQDKSDLNQWGLARLITKFIKHPEDERIFPIICDLIESYPYRLFFIETDYGSLSKALKGKKSNEAEFITSRMLFLRKDQISDMKLPQLKEHLYQQWLKIYETPQDDKSEIEDKYALTINSGYTFDNDLSNPPSLPPQFKADSHHLETYHSGDKSENKYQIEYRRHLKTYKNRNKAFKNEYYLDDLSGKSSSFYLFSMFAKAKQDKYLHQKLQHLFIENALAVIMVIDQSIFEYVGANNAYDKVFATKNIIIPFEISKNSTLLENYKRDPHEEEEKLTGNANDSAIRLKNPKMEELEVKFYQPYLTKRINTLIINQITLETLAGDDVETFIVELKTKCCIPRIIITVDRESGTHKRYKYAKYVPFSIIESSLKNNNPDKLSLMTALFNA